MLSTLCFTAKGLVYTVLFSHLEWTDGPQTISLFPPLRLAPHRINLLHIPTRRSCSKSRGCALISDQASVTVTGILVNCGWNSSHTSFTLWLCALCRCVIKQRLGIVWGMQSKADIDRLLNRLFTFITGEGFSTCSELHYVSYFMAEAHVACISFHS